MKKICLCSIILVLALARCGKKAERGEYMQWEDEYYMQICSQAFDKPGDQITYEDVAKVEKMKYVFVDYDDKARIGVFVSNEPEARIADIPEADMKSIADLVWFKKLNSIELYSDKFSGIRVLEDMPQLKTLVLNSANLREKTLRQIAKYSHVETLQMWYFHNIDYSCLTDMQSLKKVFFEYEPYKTPVDCRSLQSLPSEGCTLDLGFIRSKKMTPELRDVLCTHPNIDNLGVLYIPDGSDLEFFKDMKHLENVYIKGGELDLTGIAQMSWLKELSIWGENIDISVLSQMPDLEWLGLFDKGERLRDLSIGSLGEHKNLQDLNLYGFAIENLDGIERYPNLKSLCIEDCLSEKKGADQGEDLRDLSVGSLKGHKNLQVLELKGYVIENLDGIESYPNLKILRIEDSLVENIDALAALHQLEELELKRNLIEDISALRNLKQLKYLSLYDNEVRDISSLKNCVELKFLDLENNYIADIEPLYGFQKLEELRVKADLPEIGRSYTGNDIEVVKWRKVLLSLKNLKYYVGWLPVKEEREWVSQHMPDVKQGYSDVD